MNYLIKFIELATPLGSVGAIILEGNSIFALVLTSAFHRYDIVGVSQSRESEEGGKGRGLQCGTGAPSGFLS